MKKYFFKKVLACILAVMILSVSVGDLFIKTNDISIIIPLFQSRFARPLEAARSFIVSQKILNTSPIKNYPFLKITI